MASRYDVEMLALKDFLVRTYVDAQKFTPGLKWDEMMCSLVVALVDAKNALQAQLLDCVNRSPVQPMVMPASAVPSPVNRCYQCEAVVSYLFEDGRCSDCTRMLPEEVRGETDYDEGV